MRRHRRMIAKIRSMYSKIFN